VSLRWLDVASGLTDIIFEASHRRRTYFQTRPVAASERAFISKPILLISRTRNIYSRLCGESTRRYYTIAPGAISNLARLPLKKKKRKERERERERERGREGERVEKAKRRQEGKTELGEEGIKCDNFPGDRRRDIVPAYE